MSGYLIHKQVLQGDIGGVEQVIMQGADLDELDEQGQSPLHWAVLCGYEDIATLLLQSGANPNVFSTDGYTPRWSAVDFGLKEIIEILDSFGGRVLTDSKFERTSWSIFKGLLGESLPEED